MGFTELLTIVFIVLKLVGVISWSWFFVLLPEIIAFVVYALLIVLLVVSNIRTRRAVKKFMKR